MSPALILLLGCASPDPAGEVAPPPGPAATTGADAIDDPQLLAAPAPTPTERSWSLIGRSRPGRVDVPTLADAAPPTVSPCLDNRDANCLVEVWASDVRRRVVERREGLGHLTQGDAPGTPGPARTRWSSLGTVLGACLGDPLQLPPAWDDGASRGMGGDDWVLAFSGANPCRLEGSLRFGIVTDRADLDLLTVGGRAWHQGGKAQAEANMRALRPPTGR